MNKKKLIAPIIITILIIIYFISYAIVWFVLDIPYIIKIIGVVIPIALIGVAIYTLRERVEEIRNGEEDDISKY